MRSDALVPFVVEGAAVRGACVRMDDAAHAALAAHDYPPALHRVLGELLAATTLLAASLKFRGSMIVQLAGRGPVRLAVVECDHALALRATAQWDREALAALPPDANLASLAGDAKDARLAISLDPEEGPLYQGIVALESGSVAALLEHYLATSEQLDSRLALTACGGEVAGMIVQRLPGSGDRDAAAWEQVSATLAALPRDALVASDDPTDVIVAALAGRDVRVFRPRTPRFACRCSDERVDQALRIAGRDEVEAALRDDGEVVVTCEYCGKRYAYSPERARALFATGDASGVLH